MRTKTKRTREYHGEIRGRKILDYLNSDSPEDRKGRKRVQQLMTTLHQGFPLLAEYIEKYPDENEQNVGEGPQTEEFEKVVAKTDRLEAEICKQVAMYKRELRFSLVPRIEFNWAVPRPWTLAELRESGAVNALVSLAGDNLLPRIRECECGRWYFARFKHQRFCTSRCRDKHHQSSPEFKEGRRKYMRDYYSKQVHKNVK
jgi:hypothetical protein